MQQPRATARFLERCRSFFFFCAATVTSSIDYLGRRHQFAGEHGSFMRDVIKAIRLADS